MMMTIAEYLEENENYLDDNSRAAIEQIPENLFAEVCSMALEDMGWGDIGIDCQVAITNETLKDYDNSRINHWSERGRSMPFTDGTLPGNIYSGFQLAKGQQRHEMAVIDLGDKRLALTL
jgi:hypothetical protein